MFGFSQGFEAPAQSRRVGPKFKAKDGEGKSEVLALTSIGVCQH